MTLTPEEKRLFVEGKPYHRETLADPAREAPGGSTLWRKRRSIVKKVEVELVLPAVAGFMIGVVATLFAVWVVMP